MTTYHTQSAECGTTNVISNRHLLLTLILTILGRKVAKFSCCQTQSVNKRLSICTNLHEYKDTIPEMQVCGCKSKELFAYVQIILFTIYEFTMYDLTKIIKTKTFKTKQNLLCATCAQGKTPLKPYNSFTIYEFIMYDLFANL